MPDPENKLLVTTETDVVAEDGEISLREAINFANTQAAGQQLITFANNMTGKTITLGVNKQLPALAKNISIDGTGKNITVARDATKGDFRLFQIDPGSTSIISGLALTNGKSAGKGGAILSAGTLTLVDCVVIGNQAGQGGGIATAAVDEITKSKLTITGSYIAYNTAATGGGILAEDSDLTLSSSQVWYNQATFGGGGGISAGRSAQPEEAIVILTSAWVSGNSSKLGGGGISCSGLLELRSATLISYNTVTSPMGIGGGVYMPSGVLNYENPTIAYNNASEGDGAYLAQGVTMNKLTETASITYIDDGEYSWL